MNNIKTSTHKLSDDEIVEKFKSTITAYKCSDEEFISYIQNFIN